jgi:hypothetical protein
MRRLIQKFTKKTSEQNSVDASHDELPEFKFKAPEILSEHPAAEDKVEHKSDPIAESAPSASQKAENIESSESISAADLEAINFPEEKYENNTNSSTTTAVPLEHQGAFATALRAITLGDAAHFKQAIATNTRLLNFHIIEDEEPSSLLYKAIIFNRLEIVGIILKKIDPNQEIKSGTTALHIASSINNDAMCEIIISNGADINRRNKNGFTPFETAAVCKCFSTAQLLLQKGVDINARNKYGFTTLDNAASHGDLEEIEFLLENKAEVNIADQFGNTPLHNAVKSGDSKACELLLKHGAKADVQDKFGHSPSYYADKSGHPEIVKLLNATS